MRNRGSHVSSRGLDLHGIETGGRVYWNLPAGAPLRRGAQARRGGARGRGAAGGAHRRAHRPLAQDRFLVRADDAIEGVWWGEVNRPMRRSQFNAVRDRVLAHLREHDLFVFNGYAGADPATGCRCASSPSWPGTTCSPATCSAASWTARRSRPSSPSFTVISAPSCLADPEVHGTDSTTFILVDLDAAPGADRRHRLRRRDQEEHLHGDELLDARAARAADALQRQLRRRRRRRGSVLRPQRHRQDDAVGRPRAHPDRRRRARLGRQRGVQLRRRLLRQGDPPGGRERAGDLRHHAAFRHHPRERRVRPREPAARPGRRLADREHPRQLSARDAGQRRSRTASPATRGTSSS